MGLKKRMDWPPGHERANGRAKRGGGVAIKGCKQSEEKRREEKRGGYLEEEGSHMTLIYTTWRNNQAKIYRHSTVWSVQ